MRSSASTISGSYAITSSFRAGLLSRGDGGALLTCPLRRGEVEGHRVRVDRDPVVSLGELDRCEAVEHVGEHCAGVALERIAVAARVRRGELDRGSGVQRLAGELGR